MIGVRKREGMLGTDIFCRLGLLTTAAARPGDTACTTVIGLMMAPEPRYGLVGLLNFVMMAPVSGL